MEDSGGRSEVSVSGKAIAEEQTKMPRVLASHIAAPLRQTANHKSRQSVHCDHPPNGFMFDARLLTASCMKRQANDGPMQSLRKSFYQRLESDAVIAGPTAGRFLCDIH